MDLSQRISADDARELSFTIETGGPFFVLSLLRNNWDAYRTFLVTATNFSCVEYLEISIKGFSTSPTLTLTFGKALLLDLTWSVKLL